MDHPTAAQAGRQVIRIQAETRTIRQPTDRDDLALRRLSRYVGWNTVNERLRSSDAYEVAVVAMREPLRT